MKKFVAILLVIILAFASVSCNVVPKGQAAELEEEVTGLDPGVEVTTEPVTTEKPATTPKPTATPAATATPEPTEVPEYTPAPATPNLGGSTGSGTTGGSTPSTPTPSAGPTATPKPQTPNPTPTPTPHTHTWVEVTEQRKVVDVPGTEGHFEGGNYNVWVCYCGAEFTSGGGWSSHTDSYDPDTRIASHGGFSMDIRSNQHWVEGTPEQSHMETVVVGYKCSGCGETKSA